MPVTNTPEFNALAQMIWDGAWGDDTPPSFPDAAVLAVVPEPDLTPSAAMRLLVPA